MYLVTATEMQEMDRRTIEEFGIPGRVLMENAGRGATRVFLDEFGKQFGDLTRKKIAVMAGRGNNGGDGFVMARNLYQKGIPVTVYLLAQRHMVKGDAEANLNLLYPLHIPVIEIPDDSAFSSCRTSINQQDIWIDAILGTGLKSDVKGFFKNVIDYLNQLHKPIFAVDIPSGLNSDTGHICGACLRAIATATFGYPKIGHVQYPGADYTGKLSIIDIGIPHIIAEQVKPLQYLLTSEVIRNGFQPRQSDTHKGHTGHVLVISGSTGKTGAAAMTALSAMRSGAGLVTLGIPASLNPVLESLCLEVMTVPLPEKEPGILDETALVTIIELLAGKKCLAIGPGIGTAPSTISLVLKLIRECTVPLVIDADGVNILSGNTDVLKEAKAPVILTPHPGEMARLLNTSPREIQKDRIFHARNFARQFRVHLILKGAATVIAHPDGRAYVNTTGNPGMASGGMGDVLTGVIAGFISQGYSPEFAAHAGVYIHGSAADSLTKTIGGFGYLASEVMKAIPGEISKMMESDKPICQCSDRIIC